MLSKVLSNICACECLHGGQGHVCSIAVAVAAMPAFPDRQASGSTKTLTFAGSLPENMEFPAIESS